MVRASWLKIACGTLVLASGLTAAGSFASAAEETKPAAVNTAEAAKTVEAVEPEAGKAKAEPKHDAPEAAGHGAAGHAAGGHGHESHGAPFHPEKPVDPANPSKDLAIFTFITFCVTLLVLGKFAWGPIVAGLDAREARVAAHVAKAEKLDADAQKVLAEYERRLSTVYDEVKTILEEARKDGEGIRLDAIAKADAEILSVKDRVLLDLERAKSAALKELTEFSANVAVDLAGRLIGAQLDRGSHERLIAESLGKVREKAGLN